MKEVNVENHFLRNSLGRTTAALADQILRDVAEIAAAECGQGQQAVAIPALVQLSHCPATLWVSANGVQPGFMCTAVAQRSHMSQRATEW